MGISPRLNPVAWAVPMALVMAPESLESLVRTEPSPAQLEPSLPVLGKLTLPLPVTPGLA